MNEDKLKIFIVTHKKFKNPKMPEYLPIQVGDGESLGYIKDNIGENISHKNKNYCELTAMYWIWRNINCEIVGLTHYRRFFMKGTFSDKILDSKDIYKTLKKYDVIIPKPICLKKQTVKQQYAEKHMEKDLKICRDIISEIYEDYVKDFDEVMNRKYYSQFNMMIAKKGVFDLYAEWLFNILFEVEKRIDITDYSDYNKRVFVFLSERLFNVWLLHNNYLKVKENPVWDIEDEKSKIVIGNIKKQVKQVINRR